MRNLRPVLNLEFRYSRSGLRYRMDKKSEFLAFFDIKSIEQFFSEFRGCDELRQFVNLLVSINFRVAVMYEFHGSYCTFSKCSVSLNHCTVNLYSFSFAKIFYTLQQILFLCRPKYYSAIHCLIIIKNALTYSVESLVFIPFASTVLSNRF